MERQIRVEGSVVPVVPVVPVEPSEFDDYWQGRPHNSKLGAWVSAQSQPVADRQALEAEGGKGVAEKVSIHFTLASVK